MQDLSESVTSRPRWRFLFTPRWMLFHVIVLAGIVLMINLGFWQLRRLDERRTFNATVSQRIDEPPVPIESLLPNAADTDLAGTESAGTDLAEYEWRPVTLTGTFVPDADIEIVNKSLDGQPGSHAVTPFRLADGRLVLVNRGFVALTATAPPAPQSPVTVVGPLRRSQTRSGIGLRDPETGPLSTAHRIDIARLAPQLGAPVVPMYVEVTDRWPNDELVGGPAPLHLPELSEGNHLSYAGQWFIFSIAVAVGWVLAVRRSWRKHNPPADASSA